MNSLQNTFCVKRRSPMTYRTAGLLAVGISLIMHVLFVIMFLYGRDSIMPPDAPPRRVMEAEVNFSRVLVSFLSTAIYCFALYALTFRLVKLRMRREFKFLLVLVATLAAAFVLSYLSMNLHGMLYGKGPMESHHWRGAVSRDLFLYIVVLFSSFMVYSSERRYQIALEFEALRAENERTRYQALKNQVDPHFLFNTLNTLGAIITTDPVKARDYVQQLSNVFRYTLQNKEVITLAEEVDFTKSYCALMQIRYGDSLRFVFDLQPEYLSYQIVPLSIQTLVENAIKHNIVDKKQPLTVTIRTAIDGSTVTVSNPMQLRKQAEEGEGIGLANLAERYRLKWQKEIIIREAGGVFCVILPLIPA